MSSAAWGAVTACFVAVFGAGGYLQYRRTKPVAEPTKTAAQALEGIQTMIPVIQDLQVRLRATEDRETELMLLIAAHTEWDRRVLDEIRKNNPDFPEPPTLRRKELE